jgi:uncharacterized alpha-E superfamily protein
MLSRHADSAYWIGRYIERAEATARIVDVHFHFGLESGGLRTGFQWSSILAITGQDEDVEERSVEPTDEVMLDYFSFDKKNHNSILSCVTHARENGRSIRDQISSEMWEALNSFYLELRTWDSQRVRQETPHSFFQWVKNQCHLFGGIANRTLMLGETRDFFDAGRFLERGDQSARLLDVKYHDLLPPYQKEGQSQTQWVATPAGHFPTDPTDVGGPIDAHGWAAVLKSVGAFEAYRKTFRQGMTPDRIVQFLILSRSFPASVRHCIGRVEGCLRRVSGNRDLAPCNEAERRVGRLYNELNFTTSEEIVASGLHEFLEDIQVRTIEIGEAIHDSYLRF